MEALEFPKVIELMVKQLVFLMVFKFLKLGVLVFKFLIIRVPMLMAIEFIQESLIQYL